MVGNGRPPVMGPKQRSDSGDTRWTVAFLTGCLGAIVLGASAPGGAWAVFHISTFSVVLTLAIGSVALVDLYRHVFNISTLIFLVWFLARASGLVFAATLAQEGSASVAAQGAVAAVFWCAGAAVLDGAVRFARWYRQRAVDNTD